MDIGHDIPEKQGDNCLQPAPEVIMSNPFCTKGLTPFSKGVSPFFFERGKHLLQLGLTPFAEGVDPCWERS